MWIQFVSITFHPITYCYAKHEIIEHELIFITVASAFRYGASHVGFANSTSANYLSIKNSVIEIFSNIVLHGLCLTIIRFVFA